MNSARQRFVAAIVFAASAVFLSSCSEPGGPQNESSDLTITERNIPVTDDDGTKNEIKCLQIDSSRGVALSCAWPDSIRDFETE